MSTPHDVPSAVSPPLALAEVERETFRRRIAQLEREVAQLKVALGRTGAPYPISEDHPDRTVVAEDEEGPRLPPELLLRVAQILDASPDFTQVEMGAGIPTFRNRSLVTLIRMTRMSRACYHLLSPLLACYEAAGRGEWTGNGSFQTLWRLSIGPNTDSVQRMSLPAPERFFASAYSMLLRRFGNLRSLSAKVDNLILLVTFFTLPLPVLEDLKVSILGDRKLSYPGMRLFRLPLPPVLRKLTVQVLPDAVLVASFLLSCHGRLEPDILVHRGDGPGGSVVVAQFVQELPDQVLRMWTRFTPCGWTIFRALATRRAFKPTTVHAANTDVAEILDFQWMQLMGSVRHLSLNWLGLEKLGAFRVWPALQVLHVDHLDISKRDDPQSVAAFAEEVRRLPNRAQLTVREFWVQDLVGRDSDVLRKASHLDLKVENEEALLVWWEAHGQEGGVSAGGPAPTDAAGADGGAVGAAADAVQP
ncbi:hypothetical protein DFJ74DRAFT_58633 [Hyaloraphidium curvatum]|nr:hypothetical protein DFJ74DRAFT_58633 [Hyaloraphidium curvatum]